MLVVDDYVLDRLQRNVYYVVDVLEALVSFCFAHRLLQVEPQVADRPLRAVSVIVVVGQFGDRDVRQMDEHIISLIHIVRVLGDTKAGKPKLVDPGFQRPVTRH